MHNYIRKKILFMEDTEAVRPDLLVPVMAVCYFTITLFIIFSNIGSLPGIFSRIFREAFGFRQIAAGGFGAVLMNRIKRGLFSNEAGSGCICGYDCDLQLYGNDHASGTGRAERIRRW